MTGEKNLDILLSSMKPCLNTGEYVYCTVQELGTINISDCVMIFREAEGLTLILKKEIADDHGLQYSYIAGWITLTVHSSLEAVGLTAAFSKALAKENISCNVVAGYFHDHIFINKNDSVKAMDVLQYLSSKNF